MKIKRIIAAVVALLLIFLIGSSANSLIGNPIAKFLAKGAAKKHLEAYYSDTDFIVGEASYNFKFSEYFVRVTSPSSPDSSFSIYTNGWGKYKYDSYESDVSNRFNTWGRLQRELEEQLERTLIGALDYDFDFVGFKFIDEQDDKYMEKLELDMIVDIKNPPAPMEIYVNIISNHVTWDKIAEVGSEVEKVLYENEIPVAQYSIRIIPKADINDLGESTSWVNSLTLYNFPAERMKDENLSKVMEEYQDESDKAPDKKEAEMLLEDEMKKEVETLLDEMKKEKGRN